MSTASDRQPLALTPSNGRLARRRSGFTLIELLLIVAILAVLVALLLPAVHTPRGGIPRTQCRNNLKEIGLALHNYHEEYDEFPPAHTVDANGKPLHSWRTLLLPYLDRNDLYERIDLTIPWNAPENAAVFENATWLQCPTAKLSKSETTYLAIVTEFSCLRPVRSLALSEITDGTSNTMCVVEARDSHAVRWMEPSDLDEAGLLVFDQKTAESHTGGRHFLLMDGAARFLAQTTPHETVKALATATGGETVGEY